MPDNDPILRPVWAQGEWAAFVKPAGCETVVDKARPDPRHDFTARVRRDTGCPAWRPVHRLDRDTSGLVLMARDAVAADRAEAWFRARTINKTYLALCLGVPPNRTGTIRRALSRWAGGHKPVRVLKNGGLPAETAYVRVASSPPPPRAPKTAPVEVRDDAPLRVSLLAFYPHQGRTHQIRVHAAAFGFPILGDDQYGDRAANKAVRALTGLRRQALHAWRLTLPSEAAGGRDGDAPVTLEAPLPPDFAVALQTLLPNALPILAQWTV